MLVAAGWASSPNPVPIYDGVGTPDEPYRTLTSHPAARGTALSVTVARGLAGAIRLQTSEQGPQFLLDAASGSLRIEAPADPSDAAPVDTARLRIDPILDSATPTEGELDSNVYRLTSQPPTTVTPVTTAGFVFLRARVMTSPSPQLLFRPRSTGAWRALPSKRTGQDVVGAAFQGAGDYALVRLPGSRTVRPPGSSGAVKLLLGVLVGVIVCITLVFLRNADGHDEPARRRASRSAASRSGASRSGDSRGDRSPSARADRPPSARRRS